jgi:hypothetical protein
VGVESIASQQLSSWLLEWRSQQRDCEFCTAIFSAVGSPHLSLRANFSEIAPGLAR